MPRSFEYKPGVNLAYTVAGDLKSPVLLAQHGLVASITDTSLWRPLTDLGLCVVSVVRPGYGARTDPRRLHFQRGSAADRPQCRLAVAPPS